MNILRAAIVAAFAWMLVPAEASAQGPICPTAAPGTNNNQCASTAFVQNAVSGGGSITLPSAQILVGNSLNTAANVPLIGDCAMANTGAITCTKTNSVAFGALATLGVGTNLTSNGTSLSLIAAPILGVSGTTAGTIALAGSSSGLVTLQTAAAAGTWALTLPTSGGTSGYVLSTDGSGVTSWVAQSGGGGSGTVTSVTCGSGLTGGTFTDTGTCALDVPVTVASGGTGRVSLTNHGVLIGAGTSAVTQLAAAAAGTVLAGVASSDPAFTATPTLGIAGSVAGTLALSGSSSGTTTLVVAAAAAGTLTLPAATDTLVGKATTDSFTNKTLDTALTGNVIKINGTTLSTVTGSGSVVLATSPTLVTPTLGAATATSINGLTITSSTGTLTVANGKTATINNTLTLSGTDSTTMTFPATTTTVAGLGITQTFTAPQTINTSGTSLALGSAGVNKGVLTVAGNTSGVVTVQPAAAAGTWSLTLPTGAGSSGQYLQTDGTGVASWATVSGSGTVNSGTAGQCAWYPGSTNVVAGNSNCNISGGSLTLGQSGTSVGQVLFSGNTSGLVTVTAAAVAGTWSMTLPTSAGTNGYVLTTNGSGVTSWQAAPNGAVPVGGTTGQALVKIDGTDFNTQWATVAGTGTVTSIDVSGGTTGLTTTGGPITTNGTITLAGTLVVANGGTGRTSLTNHGVLIGAGSSAITQLAAAAAGTVLGGVASSDPAFTATPTLGIAGSVIGTLALAGNTSGTATITPQATAGTPTLTLPNASGTFAVSASAPLALSATTGNLTVTGAAGQVLAGSTPAFTATPTLGVAGATKGTLAFAGNTSGTVTVQPAAAAGTWSLTLPTTGGTSGFVLQTDGTGVTTWASTGSGTVTSVACGTGLSGGTITTTGTCSITAPVTVALGGTGATSLTAHSVLVGNGTSAVTALTVPASGTVLTGVASSDPAFSATPTLGVSGATKGTLTLAGNTSGAVTIQPQAAAGTVSMTLGNTAGTFATSATSPLSIDATTGTISVTGAAGQILAGTPAGFTATPTLGAASGTTGKVSFSGSTSGTVGLTVAAAAGTWTLTLPTSGGTNGQVLQTNGSGTTTWAAAGTGTVTSATVAAGSGISVSGTCTITTSGTCTVSQAQSLYAKCNILNFGAVGDDSTNNAATVFTNAWGTTGCKVIYVPQGIYRVNANIAMPSGNGYGMVGDNQGTSVIKSTVGNAEILTIPNTNGYVRLENMTFTRTVNNATTVGVNFCPSSTCSSNENMYINNVTILQNSVGLYLGGTAWSIIENVTSACNTSHGIQFNATSAGPLQYQLKNILVEFNGGTGFNVANSTGAPTSMGEWRQLGSFANAGYGIFISASSGSSFEGLRLYDSFFGADLNDEVYLDTRSIGQTHKISGIYTELGGKYVGSGYSTGPGAFSNTLCVAGGTSTSKNGANDGTGSGFNISANNSTANFSFVNNYANANSLGGLTVSSGTVAVTGGAFVSNGYGAVASNKNGITIAAGTVSVNGAITSDNGAVKQQYGINNIGGTAQRCGVIAAGNTSAATNGTVGSCTNL